MKVLEGLKFIDYHVLFILFSTALSETYNVFRFYC